MAVRPPFGAHFINIMLAIDNKNAPCGRGAFFYWRREEEICCRQQGVASPREQNLFTKASLAVLLARTSENTKPPSISSLDKQKAPHQKGCFAWRREEDSNLRYVSGAHTISNRAP